MSGKLGLAARMAAIGSWARQDHIQGIAAVIVLSAGAIGMTYTGWQQWPDAPAEIAPDFAAIRDTDQRKVTFFNYFLPMIEHRNEQILDWRETLLELYPQRHELSRGQSRDVEELAGEYDIEDFDITSDEHWQVLMRRVDIVPPSLALVQAANESAWGTSRFARQGNNYFGHWCFVEGCGIVPSSRPEGARHEVAAFDSPQQSVERYIRNLNSHEAYTQMRIKRSTLRENGATISGLELAEELDRYSERGDAYIEELQSMIRFNDLDALDEMAQLEVDLNSGAD